jgi:hypothetical protein
VCSKSSGVSSSASSVLLMISVRRRSHRSISTPATEPKTTLGSSEASSETLSTATERVSA